MKGLLEKLRKATDLINMLVFSDVYGRIRRLLMKLSKPYENGKRIIEGRPRHHEIASRIDSSREMVTRIVKELCDRKYITVRKDCIIINDELPKRRKIKPRP